MPWTTYRRPTVSTVYTVTLLPCSNLSTIFTAPSLEELHLASDRSTICTLCNAEITYSRHIECIVPLMSWTSPENTSSTFTAKCTYSSSRDSLKLGDQINLVSLKLGDQINLVNLKLGDQINLVTIKLIDQINPVTLKLEDEIDLVTGISDLMQSFLRLKNYFAARIT